jgi:hypothetical protein
MLFQGKQVKPRVYSVPLDAPNYELLEDGMLMVKSAPLLAEGTWTDSGVGSPLWYGAKALEASADNFYDRGMHSRHMGGAPRKITDLIGQIVATRMGTVKTKDGGEIPALLGDILYDNISPDSQAVIKRFLAAAKGKVPPLYVSMELLSNDWYNEDLQRWEARDIMYIGAATVNLGACEVCRLNEKPTLEESVMEPKDMQALLDKQAKELADAKAQIAQYAAKEQAAVMESQKKELASAITGAVEAAVKPLNDQVKALEGEIKKLKDLPLARRTGAGAPAGDEVKVTELECRVTKRGTIEAGEDLEIEEEAA